MVRSKSIAATVFVFSLIVLLAGCESDPAAPGRVERDHVDPIDWDGTKDNPLGMAAAPGGSPGDFAGVGLGPSEHLLGPELGPRDHTIIIEAIIHNASEIAALLPQNQVSSGIEVLEAAYRVPNIDAYTKSRIRLVLDILPRVERAQEQAPEETRQALSDILDRLDAYGTVTGKIEALQSMVDSGQYEAHEGIPQGLVAGIKILRDGERTIYAPRSLFNLKRMIHQDLAGAIGGAIGGAIVGGLPGAGVGALAGSAGASGADAVGQLTGWW
jgi:hypothetical protein